MYVLGIPTNVFFFNSYLPMWWELQQRTGRLFFRVPSLVTSSCFFTFFSFDMPLRLFPLQFREIQVKSDYRARLDHDNEMFQFIWHHVLVPFLKHISPENKQHFDELTTSLAEVLLVKHPLKNSEFRKHIEFSGLSSIVKVILIWDLCIIFTGKLR